MSWNRACMPAWVSRPARNGTPGVLSFGTGPIGPVSKDRCGMGETAAMAELLTLDRRDDGVAVVTLANGKVNALSGALLRELRDVAGELTADPPGAVVITG